ncbi:MAG: hypothetical protein IJ678_07040, partial [Kiritimatiellae bacterium]|nr:hypothetical protein [Kiritimatiellia bacterium]
MDAPKTQTAAGGATAKKRESSALLFAVLAACAAALAFTVRPWSIWMDEAMTFDVVARPWREAFATVFGKGNGVSAMPLYFALEIAWCRIAGFGEYAMRSLNFFFAAAALAGAFRLAKALRLPAWTLPLLLLNSVFAFYMDDARPYAAVYACGTWCYLYLLRHPDGMTRRDGAWFLFFFWIGCALHMMFAFMALPYAMRLPWRRDGAAGVVKAQLPAVLAAAPFFAALGVYYLGFAFSSTEAHETGTRPVAGALQIAYCFANLGGLGWP